MSEKNNNALIITLCHKCAKDYYNSPEHYIKAILPRGDKEVCTKCNNTGYDYIVKPRKEREE